MNLNSENNMHKKIEILDWGIVFASIIMLFMVYMPISIWNEEAEIRSQEQIEVARISQNQVIEVEKKLTETRLIEEIEIPSMLFFRPLFFPKIL